MPNADDTDAKVAEYLELMAEYQQSANRQAQFWKDGFINLAQAKLYTPISQTEYDLGVQAKTTLKDGVLTTNPDAKNPISMFGAWPPSSLKQAQVDFEKALEELISGYLVVQKIDELENELTPAFK